MSLGSQQRALRTTLVCVQSLTRRNRERRCCVNGIGIDRQLAAAITLRDQVEYVQPNDAPALLQELIPVIRRLLSDITPQFMETPEHVRGRRPVTHH